MTVLVFNKGAEAVRNVFVGLVPRDNFTNEAVQNIKITSFPANGNLSVSTPFLIKVGTDNYLLMWQTIDTDDAHSYTYDSKASHTQFVFIDGKGQPKGKIVTINAPLSDCTPTVCGNNVNWYTTNNSAPVFYSLNLSTDTVSSTITNTKAVKKSTNILPKKSAKKTIGSLIYCITKSSKKNGTVIIFKSKSKRIKSVTIPKYITWNGYKFKVTGIKKNAFNGCKRLKSLTIHSPYLSSIGKDSIKNTNKKLVIQVPKKQFRKYKRLFTKKTGFTRKMKIRKH